MLAQFLALSVKDLLGFTVLAALVTTLGTLAGLFLKEVVLSRSFEKWKDRRSLENIYRKYRDPIVLVAEELSIRLKEICDDEGADYLQKHILESVPAKPELNWVLDPYYRRYKFESTIYRLCAFFGWCELYRQEVVFLRSGRDRHSRSLKDAVDAVREALADGQLNDAPDWMDWTDHLVFREEQRAIGETMIIGNAGSRSVMGYAQFVAMFRAGLPPERPDWFGAATAFLMDVEKGRKDFRCVRIKALYVRLIDLIETLDPHRLRPSHRERQQRYLNDLPEFARSKLSFQEKTRRVSGVLRWKAARLANPPDSAAKISAPPA